MAELYRRTIAAQVLLQAAAARYTKVVVSMSGSCRMVRPHYFVSWCWELARESDCGSVITHVLEGRSQAAIVHEQRRSSRLAISVPVEIHGMDATGADICEKVSTKVVSRHGAFLVLQHRMLIGSELDLRVSQANLQKRCKVAWVGPSLGENGPYETGIEMEATDNFWGIQFPPDDWLTPAPPPSSRVRTKPPQQPGPPGPAGNSDQHAHTISAVQRALIAILEEKGLVSAAELADMLKRLS